MTWYQPSGTWILKRRPITQFLAARDNYQLFMFDPIAFSKNAESRRYIQADLFQSGIRLLIQLVGDAERQRFQTGRLNRIATCPQAAGHGEGRLVLGVPALWRFETSRRVARGWWRARRRESNPTTSGTFRGKRGGEGNCRPRR